MAFIFGRRERIRKRRAKRRFFCAINLMLSSCTAVNNDMSVNCQRTKDQNRLTERIELLVLTEYIEADRMKHIIITIIITIIIII